MKIDIKSILKSIHPKKAVSSVAGAVTHPLATLKKLGRFLGKVTSNKAVLNIAMILCATVFLFSLYNIGIWLYENKSSGDLKKSLIGSENSNNDKDLIAEPSNPEAEVDIGKIKFLTTDLNTLKQRNPDTVAWLKVMGTYVDYPVVQTTDNDYYLTHDFDKKETKAGWVFGDFRCDFLNLGRNTIIYGHERMDYSMFGSLTYCKKDWWYNKKSNHFVFLNTPSQKTVWQIFSIYVTSTDFNYIKTGFAGESDYADFIQSINSRNEVPTLKADATSSDQILTLSTCYNISKRLVVQAKLVKSESLYPQNSSSSATSSYNYSSIPGYVSSQPCSSSSSGSGSSSSSKAGSSSSKSSSSGSSSGPGSSSSGTETSETTTTSVPSSSESSPSSEQSSSSEPASSSEEPSSSEQLPSS